VDQLNDPYVIHVSTNLDADPWDDVQARQVRYAMVTRVGLAPVTQHSPPYVAVLADMGRGRLVLLRVPLMAVVAMTRHLARTPIVVNEVGL
jgi:hypothetical protein